jgi:2-desacetyl-2-hydroxyethyl bacteriochlorophyllide A dehydrogenase
LGLLKNDENERAMKAIKILKPHQLEIADAAIPTPGARDVLIKVIASGICGTDIHIFRGEYLGTYPVIPGHEFAGVVEQVGAQVTRFKPGDHVAIEPNISCDNCANCLSNRQNFCLNWQGIGVTLPGGMAQYAIAPEKAVFNIGNLPFEAGAFMEPLSCVLHGVERLNPALADQIAIIGAGPIGCLLLQSLRLRGASHVTMVDKNRARLETARELGADILLDGLSALRLDYYDAVVDATGVIPLMSRAIEFARSGGRVLLFGVPPNGVKIELDAFAIFRKGLTLLSSYTSVRNSLQAVELLANGCVRVDGLISHRLPLAEFQRGVEIIEGGLEQARKVVIAPNE